MWPNMMLHFVTYVTFGWHAKIQDQGSIAEVYLYSKRALLMF